MKKKLLSVLMALTLVTGLLPGAALAADPSTDCPGGTDCSHAAAIDSTHYATLNDAIDAANKDNDESTIKLLDNLTLNKEAYGSDSVYFASSIRTNIILDLNGKTLTYGAKGDGDLRGFFITPKKNSATGQLTVKTSVEGGKIVSNGQEAFDVSNGGKLTIEKGVTITAADSGILIVKENSTVNVYGTIEAKQYCIVGNGSSGMGDVAINVGDGAKLTSEIVGIYMPNSGTLNISGGEISGQTGVYVKSGTVNVSGGTIKGTGAKADFVHKGDGCTPTGDALVVEVCDYFGGEATANVTGGTFTSANAAAIGSYAQKAEGESKNYTPVTNFVKGGTLNSANGVTLDNNILASGLTVGDNGKVVRNNNNQLETADSTTQSGPYTVYTVKNAMPGYTYVIQTTDGSVSMASFVMPKASKETSSGDADTTASDNTFQVYKKGTDSITIWEFSGVPTFDAQGAPINCLSTLSVSSTSTPAASD